MQQENSSVHLIIYKDNTTWTC